MAIGGLASLLVHVLLLVWLIGGSPPAPGLPAVARGTAERPLRWIRIEGAGDASAGGGAPVLATPEVQAPTTAAILPPVPRPAAALREPIELDRRPVVGRAVEIVLASSVDGASAATAGADGGPASGGPAEAGEGAVRANGSPDGAYTPPRARSVLQTWSPRRSVMGLEVLVRVHLDERGHPTGPVELLPPTPDRSTNEQLVYWTRNVEYHPALVGGRPVASWAEVSYRFCYEGTTATSPPSPTFGRPDPCAAETQADPGRVRRSGD